MPVVPSGAHIHTDIIETVVLGTQILIYFHVMRVVASYVGTKVSPSIGASLGGFFTLGR